MDQNDSYQFRAELDYNNQETDASATVSSSPYNETNECKANSLYEQSAPAADATPQENPYFPEPTAAFEQDTGPAPAPKKKHTGLRKFFGCVTLAACFGLVAGCVFFGIRHAYYHFFADTVSKAESPTTDKKDNSTDKPSITIASTTLTETEDSDASEIVSQVVEQTMPAMVSVKTVYTTYSQFFGQTFTDQGEGGGSGIIIGSNETDLLIATNYHVIEDTTSVQVILADDTTHTVTVKGSDPAADLAILALPLSGLTEDTLSKIDIAVLGDSDSAKIGQMVIAIGNALGYGPSVTVGYLSAKDREITIEGNDMVLLQTNAAINSGNSGGALLNTKGEVIGINNAKLSSTEIEGICFAIPISMANPILDDLMTREILSEEEKGYLGIQVKDLDHSMSELYGWPVGVYVYSVTPGSAAEEAGIYKGDIITHVDGAKVSTSNQLINAVTAHRHGSTVEITLQRMGNGAYEEFTYTVTLKQHPDLLNNQRQ